MDIEEKANDVDIELFTAMRQNLISSSERITSTELTDPDESTQKALSEAKKEI